MELARALRKFIKGSVASDPKVLRTYSRDASIFELQPQAIVYPKHVEDIKQLVRFASQTKGLSITPRGAGTDMTGGAITDSIILDTTRYFNKLKKVTRASAIVQPGMYYRDFEKKTLQKGRILPSFPASRELCTVGGMIANNSGGEKTLAYGKTDRYVTELKAVLADGNEYTIKPLTTKQLEAKKSEKTFEGRLYKKVFDLIAEHFPLISQAEPDVSKNSSGYPLWNIWNGKTFDLTKLFVGSQGTLGIITEATLSLVKPKKESRLLVVFLQAEDTERLADIIGTILEGKPESFEMYDDHTMQLAVRFLSSFSEALRAPSLLHLLWDFRPEIKMVLTGGLPKFVLLAEFTGNSEKETLRHCQKAEKALGFFNLKTHITQTAKERQKYLTIRRESFNLIRRNPGGKHSAPFIDDLIVNPKYLPEFLPRLYEILDQYDVTYTFAGHAGDGNFHIITLLDFSRKDLKTIIGELSQKVYDLVFEYNGSITAEHNDGLLRAPHLKAMYGEEMYTIFKKIKKIFDPKNIFNPGKKIGQNKEILQHLRSS